MLYKMHGMTYERYYELERDLNLKLTAEEVEAGWHFCNAEWDGMLIHESWPEAECCSCLKEE